MNSGKKRHLLCRFVCFFKHVLNYLLNRTIFSFFHYCTLELIEGRQTVCLQIVLTRGQRDTGLTGPLKWTVHPNIKTVPPLMNDTHVTHVGVDGQGKDYNWSHLFSYGQVLLCNLFPISLEMIVWDLFALLLLYGRWCLARWDTKQVVKDMQVIYACICVRVLMCACVHVCKTLGVSARNANWG